MLCLLSSRAFSLTDEQKIAAIEVAKNKFQQLTEHDKMQAFQFLYLKYCEHSEKIIELQKKIEELEAQDKLTTK